MSTFFFDDELQRHLIKLKIQFNHMEKKITTFTKSVVNSALPNT